jgi:putative ABC transport system permease protein
MFDFDSLREIGTTIKTNKLRTFLTGFSIAWGIFMLIVLLGAGNGLKNGIESNFKNRSKNSVTIWGGYTSIQYKGLATDREVKLDYKDLNLIQNQFPEIDRLSPQIGHFSNIVYEQDYGSWYMQGVYPDAQYINNIDLTTGGGRFLNDIDIQKRRKVIVINTEMEDILFRGESALGKYVIAENLTYQVIGVFKDVSGRTNVPAYIPFSTAQSLYRKNYGMDRIDFNVKGINSIEESEAFEQKLREKLGVLHNFDPKDKSALPMWDTVESAVQSAQIFNSVTLFIWIIGICSLVAGIVGVGNIMLITVKERTREFGIRKAIGASPNSILRLVLLESIIITAIFGYLGMVLGVGLTEIVNSVMEASAQESGSGPTVFLNPTVDIGIVIQATLVLIVSGVFAGGIPAVRAVSISPVEAMRSE